MREAAVAARCFEQRQSRAQRGKQVAARNWVVRSRSREKVQWRYREDGNEAESKRVFNQARVGGAIKRVNASAE